MTETNPQRPFHIMAKPVCGVCNLDCRYCYYTGKPSELYPQASSFLMSEAVLDSFTRQYMQAQPARCEFGWQGGEPTLAGKVFLRNALALQRAYALPGQVVGNSLQTNGTLLDEEWADLLKEHGVLVGISIDGPPQWHDAFRKDHAGGGSFHRAWAGLELLRGRGVEFNVLATLHSANAPHAGDIYRYFVNRGVQYLQFIPILERLPGGEVTDFSCTAEQFGRFMLDVLEIWAERDVGRVSERFIDSVLHQLIYGAPAMCCLAPRCANAFVLEHNGDLYACDHFVLPQWRLGNIMERPLAELLGGERLAEFARLKAEPPAACLDCEFRPLCNGGCPKHHSPAGAGAARANHFCEGYKLFFREALPELRRLAEYFRRNETPPPRSPTGASPDADGASHMLPKTEACHPAAAGRTREQQVARPTAAHSLAPAKTGRNDPCPCGSGRKFKSCCGR